MNALLFLIETISNLLLFVFLLRIWLQLAKVDFYNPISQTIFKVTQPIVKPLHSIIPDISRFSLSTFIIAALIIFFKFLAISALQGTVIPYSALPFAILMILVNEVFQMLFWILIIRALLSWFSQGQSPAEQIMTQLTDPILGPIRRLIPPISGLDLSVLIALLGVQLLRIVFNDMLRAVM